jgi:hypothetical protein
LKVVVIVTTSDTKVDNESEMSSKGDGGVAVVVVAEVAVAL